MDLTVSRRETPAQRSVFSDSWKIEVLFQDSPDTYFSYVIGQHEFEAVAAMVPDVVASTHCFEMGDVRQVTINKV